MGTSGSCGDGTSFEQRLAREIEQWQQEGVLRPDQARTLRARYGLVPRESYRTVHRSRIVGILAVLGVVLVGVGVILLIGANWQDMPRWSRFALLLMATAGAYTAGYRMAFQSRRYPKVGMADNTVAAEVISRAEFRYAPGRIQTDIVKVNGTVTTRGVVGIVTESDMERLDS